jgi:hypothetical protein
VNMLRTPISKNISPEVVAAFECFWEQTRQQRDHLRILLNSHIDLNHSSDYRFDIADMLRAYAEQLRDDIHPKMEKIRL